MDIPGKNNFPLKPLIRDYVSSLSRVHRLIRELLKPKTEAWETVVGAAVAQAQEKFEEKILPLTAIAQIRLEDGEERGVMERHFLAVDKIIERRRHFERKNGELHDTSLNRISIAST